MTNTPSPDEDRELIERLRGRNTRWQAHCDRWIATAHEKGYEVTDEQERILRDNPEGTAADRLESLLADRAKLEERVRDLEFQRLAILGAMYQYSPEVVAGVCDKMLDRSGALLGEVREFVALNRTANDG